MLTRPSSYLKGDTIIEVLFAITIFSLVAVGSISIMNQGTMTAQRSLEITLVRSEIDAQAEALRFIHESYIAAPSTTSQWALIKNKIVNSASSLGTCSSSASHFIVDTKGVDGGKLSNKAPSGLASNTYSKLIYDDSNNLNSADGIWVEAVQNVNAGGQNISKYIDFHIRACWYGPGQSKPITLGTIVRLYDPTL